MPALKPVINHDKEMKSIVLHVGFPGLLFSNANDLLPCPRDANLK